MLIFSMSYVSIYKLILYVIIGMLSVAISYTLYYFLSKSRIGKSKKVFFEKSENEKLTAFELKNKYTSPFSRFINRLIDNYGSLFNIQKLEKDIQRANKKEIKSISDLVKMGFIYSFALGFTFFIVRAFIFDFGAIQIAQIVAIFAGFILPYISIQDEVKKQEKYIRIEMPQVLDLMRQGILAGLLFIDALKEARPKNGGSLDNLMKVTIAKIQTSGDHIQAIYEMADKINDTKIKEFLQQLVIAYEADRDRQIEICGRLAANVRELEEVSNNLKIEGVEGSLGLLQYINTLSVSAIFLAIILYDTFMKFQ